MFVQVKGPESAMDSVLDRIEELVLESLTNLDQKRLWMHDIAAENLEYYHESQGLVYQREPTASSQTSYPWKWMCLVPVGDPSSAIPVIAGLTMCLIRRITRRKEEFCIYISGMDWHEVNINSRKRLHT
jgi:hypothetical protein